MSEDVKRDAPADKPEAPAAAASASAASKTTAEPKATATAAPKADTTKSEAPKPALEETTLVKPAVPVAAPAPVRSRRVLPWVALLVGTTALAVGIVAIAGPRAIRFAERQFPTASWIEPAGKFLNPGWSVERAEFDRRVNLLEGVLAKAQPNAVSRQDVVDLLVGRFEGRRWDETRGTVDALKTDIATLQRRIDEEKQASDARLARERQAAEARATTERQASDAKASAVEASLKSVDEANAAKLDAAAKAIEELRGQVAALSPVTERSAKTEADLGIVTKRLDEVAAGLDELKRRTAGPERLLVAVLQLQISSQTGRAFASELRLVKQIVPADSPLSRTVEALTIPAQRGAPTVSDLRDQFGSVADAIVERGVRDTRNWAERVGANVKGTLAGIGLTLPPPLTPVEAAIMETQRQLANGNLLAALTELQTVDGPLRSMASAWVAQAQLRLSIDQAVSDITNATLESASKLP